VFDLHEEIAGFGLGVVSHVEDGYFLGELEQVVFGDFDDGLEGELDVLGGCDRLGGVFGLGGGGGRGGRFDVVPFLG
jgi:hypothetical protein